MRYIAASILFCLSASILEAKTPDNKSSKSNKKTKAEKPRDYKEYTPHVDVTPSARTCPNTSGFYVEGAYIYWMAKMEDVPIVADYSFPNGDLAKLKQMDFDWQSGFKIGVGTNVKRDSWDIFLNWTHLDYDIHKSWHSSSREGTPISPIPLPGFLAILADTIQAANEAQFVFTNNAKSKWNLDFDVLDLELGRFFFIGRYVALRPFAGLKGANIDQHFKVEYSDNLELDICCITPNPTNFDFTKSTSKQDHDAIGPRIGIDSRWNLTKFDLAFDANAAFSLLWSKIKMHSTGSIPPDNIEVDALIDDKTFMQPVFELYLGFDWRRCWKKFALTLAAGYEMQLWYNEEQLIEAFENHIPNHSNLSLQGLTASVKIEF